MCADAAELNALETHQTMCTSVSCHIYSERLLSCSSVPYSLWLVYTSASLMHTHFLAPFLTVALNYDLPPHTPTHTHTHTHTHTNTHTHTERRLKTIHIWEERCGNKACKFNGGHWLQCSNKEQWGCVKERSVCVCAHALLCSQRLDQMHTGTLSMLISQQPLQVKATNIVEMMGIKGLVKVMLILKKLVCYN